MLSDSFIATMLPVKDMARAQTVDHVCVLGSGKAAWFRDPEGNYPCIHEDLPPA